MNIREQHICDHYSAESHLIQLPAANIKIESEPRPEENIEDQYETTDLETTVCFLAISSVLNKFLVVASSRNELLYHKDLYSSISIIIKVISGCGRF